MRIGLLLCAILLATQCVQIQEINKHLGDLSDAPFAKSMTNLVSLNMKTGGPLNELKQLLQQIKDELIANSQQLELEQPQTQRTCTLDQSKLQATQEQAEQDLQNQRTEQTSLNNELSTLTGRTKDDQSSLDRNAKSSADANDRLNAENADFATKNADYSEAILACKEAQRLLMNLRTEGSSLLQLSQETKMNLVQTKDNFNKIKEILEAHTKKSSLTLFQPIIEGLMEMTAKVNPETLNNVLGLIARLITILQEGQDQLQQNHTQQVDNLTKLVQDLKNERQTLQLSLSTAGNRVKEIQARLNELDGLINITNAIVEVTKLNLADLAQGCALKVDELNSLKVNNLTEIDIVDRLIQYINEKLSE